jgi:hypothetical protein
MIKEAVFCNLCGVHIPSEEKGHAFFRTILDHPGAVPYVSERIFNRSTKTDLHLCNDCCQGMKKVMLHVDC